MLLKDIDPGAGSSSAGDYAVVGNKLYFSAQSSSHLDLNPGSPMVSAEVRFLLSDVDVNKSSVPPHFAGINDKVVFAANSEATGHRTFQNQWNNHRTKLLKDIYIDNNTLSSDPTILASYNNRAYFFASSDNTSNQLWKTNGTTSGTELVYNFGPETKNKFGNAVVF
jgi:ELWxxDGT repeat protein